MKKILIITPHFPPSNLAAVHRSRLFARHLPAFGWEPVILTVHERCYEEALDRNLEKLLPEGLRIEKVSAFPVTRPRLIGDIGLRGFFQLYARARRLIQKESFDFLYIPIPSFYAALLGRWLHRSTGIPYGIDYIDPWVHQFPGSDRIFSRHWISTRIARFLEPIAVKKASLITGVAEGYYQGVRDRNPGLERSCLFGAMPYGGEPLDHLQLRELNLQPYLFTKTPGTLDLVYAGAFLPKALEPLRALFQSIREHPETFQDTRFHFIGTGKPGRGDDRYGIRRIAEEYGCWGTTVFEYPDRIPYLDVLVHLQCADGVFVLGSTEPHYTPSKVYQGVLSGKPILAVLHRLSSANQVLQESGAGLVLPFDGTGGLSTIRDSFPGLFREWKTFRAAFRPEQVNQEAFKAYSAEQTTRQLARLLDQACLSGKKNARVSVELPAAGLGNKMLVWARGYVFARKYGLELYCSRWWGFSWGALLRRERKSRLYLGYFREDSLWQRLRLKLFQQRARIIEEPLAPETATGPVLYIFRKMFVGNDYFETLKPYRKELGQAIRANLQPALKRELDRYPRPVIGIHVRRGDFKRGSTLTPTSYFVDSIQWIRSMAGDCLPVTVFTDADPAELQELLALPELSLAAPKADILDILLLGESRICILSISSTFSFWAGFLSEGIVLKHPGEWHPSLRPPTPDDSKYEGIFDPSLPMDPALGIALKKLNSKINYVQPITRQA